MNDPQPPTPEPLQPSTLGGRLMGVFATPGEVFAEVRATPPTTANWLVPCLIWLAVGWACSVLFLNHGALQSQLRQQQEAAVRQSFARANLPADQMEKMVAMSMRYADAVMKVGAVVGPPVAAFGFAFLWGGLFWLGGVVYGQRMPFMKAVEAAGLSNLIGVLNVLVTTLLIFILNSAFASPSPVLFLREFDPTSPWQNALGFLNVIVLWTMAVRSIALAKLGGISLGKAGLWCFGIYALFVAGAIGLMFLGQMMGRMGR